MTGVITAFSDSEFRQQPALSDNTENPNWWKAHQLAILKVQQRS